MTPEAEIGLMQPPAKECQHPGGAGRGPSRPCMESDTADTWPVVMMLVPHFRPPER